MRAILPRRGLPFLMALALCGLVACAPSGGEGDGQGASRPDEGAAVGSVKPAAPSRVAEGSGFDFYVLSLSWSPSYCEAEGADANRQQCDGSRRYAFVVHGLWPQFERGYPQKCGTNERKVPDRTLRGLYDIMPSAGLIRYQWQKHGSCTGLAQNDYFGVLRAAREKIVIPAGFRRLDTYRTLAPGEVEAAFLDTNPDLPADGVAVTCDRRFLREVRICLTKQLAFRRCEEVDRRACRLRKVVMPPVRGG